MGLQQTSIPYKNTSYPHYYLCNYLPVSVGKDTLSHSLLKFKRGRQPDLNGWIDCSLEMLAPPHSPDVTTVSPGAVTISPDLPILSSNRTIIRALHHEETILREDYPTTSLDKLGSALAHRFKGHYRPYLLRKSLPTQEIKGLSKEQRETELQGLYSLHPLPAGPPPGNSQSLTSSPGNSAPSFLIVDDILTTGTTIKMIIGAILRSYPEADLLIFTLAKADYDTSFNKSTPLQGQNYQLEPGNITWIVAEDAPLFYSPEQLKVRIRTNTF